MSHVFTQPVKPEADRRQSAASWLETSIFDLKRARADVVNLPGNELDEIDALVRSAEAIAARLRKAPAPVPVSEK